MVKVKLNNLDFRYDIFQIINLFYVTEIQFVEEEPDFQIHITADRIEIKNEIKENTRSFEGKLPVKEQIKKAVFSYFTELTGKIMPWGTLVGIRPSKIALSLRKEGHSDEEIIEIFEERNYARRDKAELCIAVAKAEEKIVNTKKEEIAVYIGMPFCPTRCSYCSFTSNPIGSCKKLVKPYLDALSFEMEETAKIIKEKNLKIQSVYFGGGTPTSIEEEDFEKIMEKIHKLFIEKQHIVEFTVECGRPDSITYAKLVAIKKYGAQRISINPQTMNEETLLKIGRKHSVQDVIDVFHMARAIGFESINMDLIVGLPGETLSHIIKTCEEIEKLQPDNLTVHGMSIKRASVLHEKLLLEGAKEPMSQGEICSMYEATTSLSKKLGMTPYYMYRQKNMFGNMENVGYSKPHKEGIYNIQMIEEAQTIVAHGADAVTKVVFLEENRLERFGNIKDVKEYVGRVGEMVEKKRALLNTL